MTVKAQFPAIRFSIGTKLVGLIAVLLMSSVLSLVWLSTRMFVESDTALIQQTNADNASNLSTQMREVFQALTEKMRILGTILQKESNPSSQNGLVSEFFSKDNDFLAVFLQKIDGSTPFHTSTVARGISPHMNELDDPNGDHALTLMAQDPTFNFSLVAGGEIVIAPLHLREGTPTIVVAVPFIQDLLQDPNKPRRFTHFLVAFVRQSKFVKAFFESESVTSYMVNHQGMLLAHPDPELVNSRENFSQIPIVRQMLDGKFNNSQTKYIDPRTGESKLGAYRLIGFGGLGVITEVLEAKAFEGAQKVVYRAALVAWIILCLSFFAGYIYSGTITWPILKLVEAAKRISEGDFKINLLTRGRDEVANLSFAFNEMAKGLEERDKVKAIFNKFHNKEITDKLLSGEVKLGGERLSATVFFSDVRGFTSLSETLEPEAVVEMLNEYMTRMVAIIRSYGGVVDKYVGDAIMAIWGVPLSGPDDTFRAVRACLAMREDLAKLNELRESRGQPVLKIGMGLNCGPLIAGNIGSDEKMEYTVIGDAVNLASRVESMTKEYGTDLLISNWVYDQVKDRFVFESAGSSRVKGKSEAIEVYKVNGYFDEAGQPVLVETPYSSYTAEKSDKVVHT